MTFDKRPKLDDNNGSAIGNVAKSGGLLANKEALAGNIQLIEYIIWYIISSISTDRCAEVQVAQPSYSSSLQLLLQEEWWDWPWLPPC